MQLNKAILRIFEVEVKDGYADVLQEKFAVTSVAVVDGKPGNLGYLFGRMVPTADNNLVFISVWKDLEAVKSRFGADWQEAFLPEGYEDMIISCSIKHIECDGALNS